MIFLFPKSKPETKMTENFYIFSGVDGAGKTTMSKAMPGKGHIDRCDKLDDLTMTCDYSKWPATLDDHEKMIILTADMDVLRGRIDTRDRSADLFETDRALYYYDCRFREIASYYGIPIIDTTGISTMETVWAIRRYDQPLTIPLRDMDAAYCAANFELLTEGESKKVYADPYNSDFCYIVLKNTIYSHSKQSTGEIEGLGAIRAENCRYFLNALRKNGIRHSYVAINDQGVIYSRRMHNINPLEVVVKEYVEGTDKHSYYGFKSRYADPEGRYLFGPYVRFDWRNPNHVDDHGVDVRESLKDYYKIEADMGKEAFFEKYLTKPMGDKTISTKIIDKTVVSSVDEIEKQALRVYNTLKYYLMMINLTIKDVCFMFSEEDDGHIWCWSEINQDCMRVANNNNMTHDKDLWRAGGSACAELLVEKWKAFNAKFRVISDEFRFDIHKPHEYDYVTAIESCYLSDPNNRFTHTDHYMGISREGPRRFVVMNDTQFADSLFTLEHSFDNRDVRDNYPHVEVSNIDDAIMAISNSARRVMVPSFDFFMDNKDHTLFSEFGERVIVPVDSLHEAITVYSYNEDIAISVVIYEIDHAAHEIHLNYPYRKKFMVCDELSHAVYAWNTHYVPIVPSTIKKAVASKSICSEYVDVIYQHYDGTVVDRDRVRYTLMFFNDKRVEKYIFDKKEGTSILCIGDYSDIINMSNTVFSNQSVVKSNILSLYESTPGIAYSDVRLTNSVWDAHARPETLVSDFLSLLKFKGIDLRQVLNNLNADRWNVFKDYDLGTLEQAPDNEGVVSIAVTGSKYCGKTEEYLRDVFGIELLPAESPRSLYREFKVVDQEKFGMTAGDHVNDKVLKFLMCKPKDMPYLLSAGYVKGAITYDSVMCRVVESGEFVCVKPIEDPSLSLCLIKRKGEEVVFPVKVAAEHPHEVRQYLDDKEITEIVSISGSSESYLVNRELGFSLADAVVESGKTLVENNLEVYETLKSPLTIGLYLKK